MSILLISDDDRSALACELLAMQLRKRGKRCLTLAAPPASSLKASHSPLPPCEPQITMALDALLGTSLLEQASRDNRMTPSHWLLIGLVNIHTTEAESLRDWFSATVA